MGEFFRRVRFFLSRRRLERELASDMEFHREMAARVAGVPFGNDLRLREESREAWGWMWLEDLGQDLRFAARMLRRSPGFSLLALLCLTVGIGAATAVFSWIEGILLRPFPAVAHQERMMAMAGTNRGAPGHTAVSWPNFLDLRRNCTLFDWFIVDRIMGATLSIGDRAERATGSVVSSNYFEALGVQPILGRGFEPEEELGRNAHPVTVISYQTWRERYRGDPQIVGKKQILSGVPHTIVGVAPPGFQGTFVGWAIQFWVPVSMEEQFDPPVYKLEDRGAGWIEGFARLKPGVTQAQAQAEISAIAKRLEAEYPDTNRGHGIELYPLWRTPFNGASTYLPMLAIALAVVVFVLLIACANVGNLLLVRALGRRREMTVRLSMGAGRGRLLKQLLTEGLVLATLAAAGGLLVANWSRNLLILLIPGRGGATVFLPGAIDWRVLAVSAAVCIGSTLLFALVPALQASRVDLAAALKAEAGGVVGGRGRGLARSGLVVVQMSLSFVLLVGAGLLFQSLRGLREASPGFSTGNVLSTAIDFTSAGYNAARAKDFEDDLIDRVQAIPGVQAASFARLAPFSYRIYSSAPIAVDGYVAAPDEQPTVDYNEIGPGYLATLGIPLVAGREFTRADNETAPPVAIVNEAMAAQYWRGQDPVGQRLQVKGRWLGVVGVARISRYRNLTETPRPFFYVPLRQSALGQGLLIRTSLGPGTMARSLAREIHALDANLAAGEMITMREQVDRTTTSQQTAVLMLGVFGGLALLLAVIGLYGVMSYTVSQSSRELGLRMALGASTSDVLRLVIGHGVRLSAAGMVVGAAAALGLTRLMGSLLYNVSPRDPLAFGSALVVMTVAASAACCVPAWRATRADPVRALRE
jgi:predicted permease